MPPMNKKQLFALIGTHIRVEGAHFNGDMTLEQALALMSGLQERLGTEAQGKSSQKWAFLDGLRELLTESLGGEANGERSCELCRHDDSNEDFDRHDMGSTPLGGNKSEEEGSDEDDDDRCPGLKHVPAVLRQAVLIVVWRVLLVNRANNDVLLSEMFGALHEPEEEEDDEEKEVSDWKKMVKLALDSVSIQVDVGHHDQAIKGKARGMPFRLGQHKGTVELKVSTLVLKGPDLLQSLSRLTTLKSVFSARFGSVNEVGIAGEDVLHDPDSAHAHQLDVVEKWTKKGSKKTDKQIILKFTKEPQGAGAGRGKHEHEMRAQSKSKEPVGLIFSEPGKGDDSYFDPLPGGPAWLESASNGIARYQGMYGGVNESFTP